MTKILGIESTCDETSAAVVKDGRIVLSNIVASQEKIHAKYGGIVPEVASRKHLEALPIVVNEALKEAKVDIRQIEAIAVSKEPGLPPALTVGYAYAQGLALANKKKLLDVNHLEAHMSAVWLAEKGKLVKKIPYPYICLLVSGGHTQIYLVGKRDNLKILGKTRDDAAGEAFDKVARLLGLGYPGGPIIDKLARKGDESAYKFPRPMIDRQNFNFSFSGLKTSVRKKVRELEQECENYKDNKELHEEICSNWIADVAASFQEAVVEVLVSKTIRAANELGIDDIAMAGGVSANSRLRDLMARACNEAEYDLHYPEIKYCLDNAAMVAARGFEVCQPKAGPPMAEAVSYGQ
jgi:N6-L-threonylcarbamoyladenine synthase